MKRGKKNKTKESLIHTSILCTDGSGLSDVVFDSERITITVGNTHYRITKSHRNGLVINKPWWGDNLAAYPQAANVIDIL